jgi:hypothetical protein
MILCHINLTILFFIFQESVQEKNVQQYSDTFLRDLPRKFYLLSTDINLKIYLYKFYQFIYFIVYYCHPSLITDDGVVERTCKITFSADSKPF